MGPKATQQHKQMTKQHKSRKRLPERRYAVARREGDTWYYRTDDPIGEGLVNVTESPEFCSSFYTEEEAGKVVAHLNGQGRYKYEVVIAPDKFLEYAAPYLNHHPCLNGKEGE